MGIIYKSTSPTGKSYVGQSKYDLSHRKNEHIYAARYVSKHNFRNKSGCCEAFYRALMKYGPENFQWTVLIEDIGEDELDYNEIEMINMHNTLAPNGYNLTGGGNTNKIISEDTCKKISINTRLAMKELGTKLKRTTKSKGCSLYVGHYTYRKREGYRIQGHPKCSHKEFDMVIYKTLDACKIAAEEYLAKLDSGEIVHEKPKRKA